MFMKSMLDDTMNMISKLSKRKLKNATRVLSSYYKSRITGKALLRGMPLSLSVEPTTSCNLRCPECPSGLRSFTRPTGMLSQDLFENILNELSPDLIYLILYFQGEPYLNPHFFDFIRYAAKRKIYTATSTNAHYLDNESARSTVESGLDRLIISIDGSTQETYEKYRIGGSIDKVWSGLENIVNWKKKLQSHTPHLIVQFLVLGHNQHQIEEIKQMGYRSGADEVVLKTAQIYDYENGSRLIPDIGKYARYEQNGDDGKWYIKNKLLNHCWKMWHSSVITWDGRVLPCCFDKDASHQMGNLSERTFRDIWQGESYQNFRKSLLRSRKTIDICQNCTEGTKIEM